MKGFFSILKWQDFKLKLSEVSLRFPLPLVISIVITALFFWLIGGDLENETQELIGKYIMTGVVTFFLATGLCLLGESLEKTQKFKYIWQVIALVFGGFFFLFLSSDFESIETVVFFLLTLFGIISFLFVAPYAKHIKTLGFKSESYYVYFYRIAVVFFISFIVGGALALLGNIAIAAVRTLFDIGHSFAGDAHGYWTALALALLTPVFALTQIPNKEEFEENYFNENAFFNFLIRYIAIPFIYVYFFILYAYSAKVLMNFSDWPKGEVSWMVIGFSLFGYATYMFSYIFECGNKKENHKLIILFRKFFPVVVIPQIAMLFYAIGLRIGQYDLTMNRYFVVVFGLWLFATSLYLVISKKKSLLYIPALLTLFSIIISIGPWSVYHLPLSRQTERLENNLIQANILKDGIITPLEDYSNISKDLSNQIYDGIDYICDFRSCNAVKDLFPDLYAEIYEEEKLEHEKYQKEYPNDTWRQREYTSPSNWEIVDGIAKKIKVQRHYGWENENQTTFNIYSNDDIYPLNVEGYSMIINVNDYDTDINASARAIVNIKDQTIKINKDDISETIDISELIVELQKIGNVTSSISLGILERSYEVNGKIFSGTFIVERVSLPITTEDYDEDKYYNLDGVFLLR